MELNESRRATKKNTNFRLNSDWRPKRNRCPRRTRSSTWWPSSWRMARRPM